MPELELAPTRTLPASVQLLPVAGVGAAGPDSWLFAQRVGRYAGWLAIGLVAVAVALLTFGPLTGSYRTLTVLSGSMRPYLQPGDVVVVSPVRAADLHVGDVITYYLPGAGKTLVTHRIVRIVTSGELPTVQTKGDANNTPDEVVQLGGSQVWRAQRVVADAGWALNFFRSPKLRLVGSVAAPIMLLGVWLLSIWGKKPAENSTDAAAAAQ